MAHLKQFDVTCKVGLTMQLIFFYSIQICSVFYLNWRVAHLIQFDVTCKVGLTMQKMASETGSNERQQYIFRFD